MKLVDEWRQFWRWWSVRLAILAGVAAGYISTPQGAAQMQALVDYVPDRWRPFASLLVGLTVATLPTLARLIQQGEKSDA